MPTTPTHLRLWIRHLALPIALHVALCLGLYQLGFSNREMRRLLIDRPSHLIDTYVNAVHLYGPIGAVRAYFRGESDERLYFEYATLLLRGHADMAYIADRQNDHRAHAPLPARAWPYRDVRVEYPPLAFLALAPPALFATTYAAYRWVFILYMLLLHVVNLWLGWRLLHPQLAPSDDREQGARRAGRMLYGSLLFCAALGSLVTTRMDHIAVTWTLLSLLAFERAQSTSGRARLGWAAACGAVAALGVMTKLVPGLAALAGSVLWLRSGALDRYRCVLACALGGAIGLSIINLPMLALVAAPYWETFRYHGLRGVQIESIYAGVLLLLRPLGPQLRVDESFGSTNLASSATELIKLVSPCLFLVATAYVLLRRRFAPTALGATVLTSVLLLLFMLTNRVFSPQYLIWIAAPLLVLAAHQPAERRSWWTCLLAVLLSQLIFPRGYPLLKAFHPLAVVLLNLRNGLLVWVVLRLVRAYSRPSAAIFPTAR